MSESCDSNFMNKSETISLTFTGTSITGDFTEALRIAVAEAKRQLNSSLVHWQLASVDGTNSAFVGQNDITATIYATADGDQIDGAKGNAGPNAAVAPEKRYSYHFDYGFLLVRSGTKGGYMLGVEPPGPTTPDNPSYFTTCKLTYKGELDVTISGQTIHGWVYQATQYTQNEPGGRANNPDPMRFFFLAAQDDGNGKYYIGHSNVANDAVKFQNRVYKDKASRTEIDG